MAVYFIRHGMDDEGFRGGWSQRGLITGGYRQSEKLGRYLKDRQSDWNIGRLYCSDLQRAVDTANEIGRELQMELQRQACWREINNGEIAGMPHEIVEERYPGLYFSALRMDERYPRGESPHEFYSRIQEAWAQLCGEQAKSNHTEHTIVVTHGGVINVVYHLLKGIEWSNKNRSFPVSHTSIHKFECLDGEWEIAIENLTGHL